jgi:ABC-2 type transport system ATP-binding protein
MIGMFAHFFPHPRPVGEVIELVGLENKRSSRVVKLSGGQQRRLDVAIALAGDPELLLGGKDLPGAALRRRIAGRVHRDHLSLDRRPDRGRLGGRRSFVGRPVL